MRQQSIANVQGMSALPEIRLIRKLGELPSAVLAEIHMAVRYTLDRPGL
ncbi:MAG: hypothetical protein ACPGVO_02630 [Spirulinaceae cyanobacterium]